MRLLLLCWVAVAVTTLPAASADRFQMIASKVSYIDITVDASGKDTGAGPAIVGGVDVFDTQAGTYLECGGGFVRAKGYFISDHMRCKPGIAIKGLQDTSAVTYSHFPFDHEHRAYPSFFRLEQSAARISFCLLVKKEARLECTPTADLK